MRSTSGDFTLRAFQLMVVERSPIRSFAADFPISMIFKLSRLCLFHHCVVVHRAVRGSQQFKAIHYKLSYYSGLSKFSLNLFDYQVRLHICQSNPEAHQVPCLCLPRQDPLWRLFLARHSELLPAVLQEALAFCR